MTKKKSIEDIYFPIPKDFDIAQQGKPPMKDDVIKRIIQSTVRAAFKLSLPSEYMIEYKNAGSKRIANQEQMDMVIHLIESMQPTDAIEAALASQFAITYIRGIGEFFDYHSRDEIALKFFEFGHQVLEAFQKYRSKGAQQISVQYNVNKGQVFNMKNTVEQDKTTNLQGAIICE